MLFPLESIASIWLSNQFSSLGLTISNASCPNGYTPQIAAVDSSFSIRLPTATNMLL